MGIEIERKFLLKNDHWKEIAKEGIAYRQGYFSGAKKASLRIRVEGNKAKFNIKSLDNSHIRRQEYEYTLPLSEAEEMLDTLCDRPLIEKVRYHVPYQGHIWEIDIFSGDNAGLMVAEIELQNENEKFAVPTWIGKEVSDDMRYYNINLVKHPYCDWKDDV